MVSLSAPLLFGGLFLNLMFGGGRTLGNFTILPLGTLSLLVAVADTKRLKDPACNIVKLHNWIAAVFNGNNPEGRFAGFRNL